MNKRVNKCETNAELQSTCGHQTSTSHTASLTSHDEPDRWWRQGILGCEVGGRHLALPFTIVKLQCGSSDPQAAVPRVLVARPLILLGVYANWLQQRCTASHSWSFSEALEQGCPTSTHRTATQFVKDSAEGSTYVYVYRRGRDGYWIQWTLWFAKRKIRWNAAEWLNSIQ